MNGPLTRINVPVDQIVPVYCQAMLAGFLGNTRARRYGTGYTEYVHEDTASGLTVTDRWLEVPGGKEITGSTIVTLRDRVAWVMQYHGEYSEEVLPFLKRALRSKLGRGQFLGGRGPEIYPDSGLTGLEYTNTVKGDWDKFEAYEEIHSREGKSAEKGWHRCNGLLLLPK